MKPIEERITVKQVEERLGSDNPLARNFIQMKTSMERDEAIKVVRTAKTMDEARPALLWLLRRVKL